MTESIAMITGEYCPREERRLLVYHINLFRLISLAKTSPYRSQIRARLASPGPSSRPGLHGGSSSRSHSADRQHHQLALAPYLLNINSAAPIASPLPFTGEKAELRKLNDTFLSYIE